MSYSKDVKTFTVLVYEAEEGGYSGECLELDCSSQGETLDEMDHNIREAIEGVLEVLLEDGDDISAIHKATVAEVPANVRKWELSLPLPSLSPA